MPATNPGGGQPAGPDQDFAGTFQKHGNVTFHVKWPDESKVVIFADKEQLNGIFSNLIKNGIQSIPQGSEGID